ncbi:recombination-associated protein RdgC [Reinekea marina]|uniref:Recombination-associated protein RdgC n=1 Tax=Reinekea marina TaxID=1310421 RepID=A0ABV7WSP7_9GAMM|nr:recombination-associated protein RdgC [Reinekea marina]MDN3648915.1 recombination-associated protein RdgC [Reinekea marina]
MWFKNVQVYRFTESVNLNADQLDDALASKPFNPLSQMQESTFGWVPPYKDSEIYAEPIGGRLFFCAQIQEKILPASVLNEQLTDKLDAIEEAEGRRPGKKEREQLKEDLRAVLLPKAFHKTKRISAWIDVKRKWLVINSASEKTADDFTAQLREALGTLLVTPLGKNTSGADLLTDWFLDLDNRPNGTELEAELELAMAADSTVKARYKNLDLEAPEIKHSLDSGMRIIQMALAFEDQFQFVINEKFQMKRLKFQEKLVEQAGDSDDPRTDALIMSDSISQWLLELEKQLNEGEQTIV